MIEYIVARHQELASVLAVAYSLALSVRLGRVERRLSMTVDGMLVDMLVAERKADKKGRKP